MFHWLETQYLTHYLFFLPDSHLLPYVKVMREGKAFLEANNSSLDLLYQHQLLWVLKVGEKVAHYVCRQSYITKADHLHFNNVDKNCSLCSFGLEIVYSQQNMVHCPMPFVLYDDAVNPLKLSSKQRKM